MGDRQANQAGRSASPSGAPSRAPRFFSPPRCAGFSLIELAVTITVLVIIGYFIVSTFQPKEALALQQAERLRNDVRHMQMLALTWNTPLRLTTAVGSYQVCCLDTATSAACLPALPVPPAPCAVPDPIVDPATGRPFQVALEPGLTLAGPPGVTLNIDGLGRPANGAALLTVNAIYTINGASIGRTVTVAPLTGFATAQ